MKTPDISQNEQQIKSAKKLWSYRLYYKPNDTYVRKDDIVSFKNDTSVLYLVVSADCDLARFWSKNLGYINLIPMLSISRRKEEVEKLGLLTKTQKSLISTISEPFLTPCIQHILNAIEGYGQPDYPKIISNDIAESFKTIFNEDPQ